MLEGMYSAAAGMAAQQERLSALSNDLANVNTTGYKRVRVAFRDLVYTPSGPGTSPGVQEGSGSAARSVGRGAAQGALKRTDRNLDVALQGPGFLRVTLADGRQALTRDGALQVDGAGRLTTAFGGFVEPRITLPRGTGAADVAIAPDGTVSLLTGEHTDMMLGVDPEAPRREWEVILGRESVVVLYSDGLVERRDQDLDHGTARLQAVLADLAGRDLDELCDELLARMLPDDPDDDVALVAVRLHPQDRPRPPEAGPNRVPPGFPTD